MLVAESLIFALLLAPILLTIARKNPGPGAVFVFFLIASFAIHFRPSVFFFWDDWSFLERIRLHGLTTETFRYYAHYFPLFTFLFAVEAKLFGDKYLGFIATSMLLHAVNSTLVYLLLRRLARSIRGADAVSGAFLLSFLFLASSVHVESLQEAIIQNNLLCEIFVLSAVLAALRYFERGASIELAGIGAACFAAPLSFGLGFAAPFQILLVSMISRARKRQVVTTFAAAASGALAAAVLYAAHPNTAPAISERFDFAGAIRNADGIAEFLFVGTQLGTVLRGFGAFPFAQISAPGQIAGDLVASPELILACAGLAISIALFVWGFRRRGYVVFWIGGQLWMLSCFFPAALGRWQMGPEHSLFPRYQYGALIGLAIVVLPFLTSTITREDRTKSAFGRVLLPASFVSYLFVQLSFGRAFTFFSDAGERHRRYAAELAAGTESEYPSSIAPHSSSEQILETLQWLNPERYQK